MNKTLFVFLLAPLTLVILSFWVSPFLASIFGMFSLLLSLTLSTHAIYTKHAGTEHARAKILKEVGVMVLTLVIVLFLGGIASMLANVQVSVRWGEVAGLVSAIAASFGVGYIVCKGLNAILIKS